MPFVLVDTVRIENLDRAVEGLHSQVIPGVKQAPGFVRGIWSADRETGRGIGVITFETREQAEAVKALRESGNMTLPPGVTPETTTIYEVRGEA